jgi:hypothetical protein
MSHPGIPDMVGRLDDEYFTIGQVADRIGKSRDTIYRWFETHPELKPNRVMPLGDKGYEVTLYSAEDIARLAEFAETLKPGRPFEHDYEPGEVTHPMHTDPPCGICGKAKH